MLDTIAVRRDDPFFEALRQANISPRQRVAARMAYRFSRDFRQEVSTGLEEANIDPENLDKILEFLRWLIETLVPLFFPT